jgi:putative inorganic carbon (HCO3(-)) transporter
MRDFLVIVIVFGSIPFVLVRPHVGILMWFWLSLMNPHRLAWGYANAFRVALVVGAVTLGAWFVSKEPKRPPHSALLYALLAFIVWVSIATMFAIHPEISVPKWEEVAKILLMTVVTTCLVQSRERIDQLVWVIVASIGFYGVRGGVFTVLTGGNYHVWGPPDSFIEDNNQLALALIMLLPLMSYLRGTTGNRWVRLGLWATMGLTLIAILGTYSRGGFIALVATLGILWIKSRQRIVTGAVVLAVLGAALTVAPQQWYERMATISEFQQDQSAVSRIESWTFSYRLALDHPIFGGGMDIYQDKAEFLRYVPDALTNRAVHSIYFQILCDVGFVGLAIYLIILALSFATARSIIRKTRDRPDLQWAGNLAAMIQVSIFGYALAGGLLGLGYFDLYYALVAVLVATQLAVRRATEPSRSRALKVSQPREAEPGDGVHPADQPVAAR